ncbi:MAG: acyltransferase family protein [Candidatus Thorarchaeota archaeon]
MATEDVSAHEIQPPEQEDQLPERKHYFQLDVLKAVAIAFVVLDHSLTWDIKRAIGGPFWERTSIPFFLLVMGFNMALSFRHSGATTLKELYSLEYFSKRVKRYVLPFMILYAVSILAGLYYGALEFNQYSLIGWLPFWGPGNWFIPVLLSSILVFPAVYWAFTKSPRVTVLLCFLSEIILQLVMSVAAPLVLVDGRYVHASAESAFLTTVIRTNILFLLPAVGLGLWFSRGYELKDKRNRFMAIAFPLSFIYLFAYQFFDFRFAIIDGIYKYNLIWGDYTFLVYPYSALIFLLAMKYLPSEPQTKFQGFISKVGRASYHIFLFQIYYFSIWYFNNPGFGNVGFESNTSFHLPFYLVNLAVTFIGGLLWYTMEKG